MNYSTINKQKTILAILIPIIELALVSYLMPLVVSSRNGKIIFSVLVAALGFIAALALFGDVLKKDWPAFRKHLWRNLGIALLSVVLTHLLLFGIRQLLGAVTGQELAAGTTSYEMMSMQAASLGLLGSATSLMAPFTEEIIFRHALFYQWKGRGIVTWLMLLVSSLLFGLVHWNNFDGDIISMIPYMCIGVFFALIYYFSKNIWQNIMTHFFFDSIAFLSALVVFVFELL